MVNVLIHYYRVNLAFWWLIFTTTPSKSSHAADLVLSHSSISTVSAGWFNAKLYLCITMLFSCHLCKILCEHLMLITCQQKEGFLEVRLH